MACWAMVARQIMIHGDLRGARVLHFQPAPKCWWCSWPVDLQLNSPRLNSCSDETGVLLSVRGFALTRLNKELVVSQPLFRRWNHDTWGKWASMRDRACPGTIGIPGVSGSRSPTRSQHFIRLPEPITSLCLTNQSWIYITNHHGSQQWKYNG